MLSKITQVILDKPAQKKLQLMNYLFRETIESVSLNTLCKELSCTYPTLQTLCTELQEDFSAIGFKEFKVKNGKISWDPSMYPYRDYQQFLIQQSISYRWVKTTLLYPEKSVESFCRENFISRATLTRKLKPLTDFLAPFSLRVSLSKMQLLGKREASIRIIYSHLFWLGSFGEDLFEARDGAIQEKQLVEGATFSVLKYINHKEIMVFLTVARIRYEMGYHLTETPLKNIVFPEQITDILTYAATFISDPVQAQRQVDFLGYMIYYYPYFVDEMDDRITSISTYFCYLEEREHYLTKLVHDLLNFIKREKNIRPLNSRELLLLKMNLFITFLNCSFFEEVLFPSIDLFLDNTLNDLQEISVISDTIEKYLKKVSRRKESDWIKFHLQQLTHTLATTIFPFYNIQQTQNSVNVTVIPTPDYLAMKDIKDYLDSLGFVNYYPFSTELKDIDLWIASSEKLLPESKKADSIVISFEHSKYYKNRLFNHLLAFYNDKKLR